MSNAPKSASISIKTPNVKYFEHDLDVPVEYFSTPSSLASPPDNHNTPANSIVINKHEVAFDDRVEEYDLKFLEKIKKMDTRISYDDIFKSCSASSHNSLSNEEIHFTREEEDLAKQLVNLLSEKYLTLIQTIVQVGVFSRP